MINTHGLLCGRMQEHILDLRGYQCPLPVLKTRHYMRKMVVGEKVRVLTDDPLAAIDIPNFVQEHDQKMIAQDESPDGGHAFLLVRCGEL